jgi:hypothetical protein
MQGSFIEIKNATKSYKHNIKCKKEDTSDNSNIYKQIKRLDNMVGLLCTI